MRFNNHFSLEGRHAFLSASKGAWINYDDDKMQRVYVAAQAARRGTELHDLAHQLIRLNEKLPRSAKTLNMYVNDCIGFRMKPEQVLFVSDNCFGTADAISFKNKLLRISDLKTGKGVTSEHQLEIYAAMFCIEYRIKPFEIEVELRIYQNDEVRIYNPDPGSITLIMEQIKHIDRMLMDMQEEENL